MKSELHKCSISYKIYKNKGNLRKHLLTIHSTQSVTCESCQGSFKYLPGMFNCEWCIERGEICKWCERRLPTDKFIDNKTVRQCCANKKNHKKINVFEYWHAIFIFYFHLI